MISIDKQLEIIKRGCVDIVVENELIAKLKKGKPLVVHAGFDPTRADLHLGHTVLMHKMRQFQELGHHVIFLIGDYTAQIGDPSGRDETRPTLSRDIIEENSKTYVDQAMKIMDKKKTEIRYNSEWFNKMTGVDFIKLSSEYTVARMLERDDFKKRYRDGHSIRIHEFIYPLLQGQDSVELKADVELGGSDQIFNLLVGRELQRENGQQPQVVLTMPLLIGTDGIHKMSKSYDNYIGITEKPSEMFGKIMSISDDLMWQYYELLSCKDIKDIKKIKEDVVNGNLNPKIAKINLAKEIIELYHDRNAAEDAALEFEKIFAKKGLPTDIEEVFFEKKKGQISVVDMVVHLEMIDSKSDARRMIKQGGISLNDEKIMDINCQIEPFGEQILKVGKRKFRKLIFK